MVSGRETSKYAVRAAVVGVAMTIGLLGPAAPASALPGSGSATGSATGSADLASGSASGSSSAGAAGAAGAYLTWQSAQFIQKAIQMLLAVPRNQL
ncbi:hypothetical protein ATM97_26235 [Nocardia sp. MH4]|uniref:hypothetical protein n=1 Tax=unclassified Nocardia TaxID=2637762 RepID=UPI001C4F4920|nr:hypothetical protein [Nocardia sp. MH4]MBW0273581.1 hypothetical protein [Nocardia sp. MH4]